MEADPADKNAKKCFGDCRPSPLLARPLILTTTAYLPNKHLTMVSFSVIGILLAAGTCEANIRNSELRQLQENFERIAGYLPQSLVTDHNALDLDQWEIQKQLAIGTTQGYTAANSLYNRGAFSKSTATVLLPDGLTVPIMEGTPVIGISVEGDSEVYGTLFNDYPVNATILKIQYAVSEKQSDYVRCQVGANPNPFVEGCFSEAAGLNVSGLDDPLQYAYNALTNNGNERTIKMFSTDAQELMYDRDNRPYPDYKKFYEYYGQYDYAHQWVQSAFDGIPTSFDRGNADFTLYSDAGRTEAIQKGTAYMSIFMYVIREMEDALDDCDSTCTAETCNNDPNVHSWDEAVAFYTGSLEGKDGSGVGVLMYSLADKRCFDFSTCGEEGNSPNGGSMVNAEIFRQFQVGQEKVLARQCEDARATKNRIVQLMTIPLIQGTIRYARTTNTDADTTDGKAEAEGATFAAAVLPFVYACSPEDADIIYTNMKVGQTGKTDFVAVKEAFERNYDCLELECSDVGGLYDVVTQDYFVGGGPCSVGGDEDKKNIDVGLAVGLSIGGILLVATIVAAASFYGPNAGSLTKAHEPAVETEVKGEAAEIS